MANPEDLAHPFIFLTPKSQPLGIQAADLGPLRTDRIRIPGAEEQARGGRWVLVPLGIEPRSLSCHQYHTTVSLKKQSPGLSRNPPAPCKANPKYLASLARRKTRQQPIHLLECPFLPPVALSPFLVNMGAGTGCLDSICRHMSTVTHIV